jgi:hypothetical protein
VSARGSEIPPLLIFGADPGGILLLANYLGLHTHLEPVYDTGFVADVARLAPRLGFDEEARAELRESVERWREAFWEDRPVEWQLPFGPGHVTFLPQLLPATERLLAADDDPVQAARAFLDELFAVQLGWAQKLAWVNASRRYSEALPELAGVFPDGIFLHVAREGAADPELPTRVVRARYEDLIERPADELSRLCGELGLPEEGEKIVLLYENAVPLPQASSDAPAAG